MWADAMQKKASLVNYTKDLFEKLKNDERKKVDLWAEANKYIVEAGFNEDITFYAEIVSNNSSIPVVLTDNEGKITSAVNVDFDIDTIKYLKGKLKEEFSVSSPGPSPASRRKIRRKKCRQVRRCRKAAGSAGRRRFYKSLHPMRQLHEGLPD